MIFLKAQHCESKYFFRECFFASPVCVRYPIELAHLWLHESSRVYSDKLMEEKDIERFNKVLIDTAKRCFEVWFLNELSLNNMCGCICSVLCQIASHLSKV